MNIVIFINKIYGGGAERVAVNLANFLVTCGHRVELLSFSNDKTNYKLADNVSVKKLITLSKNKNKVWYIFQIYEKLKRYIINNPNVDRYIAFLPMASIMLLMMKRRIKCPVIISERNNPSSYKKVMQYVLRWISRRADGIVFQTENAREWYNTKVRNIIIPNAINEEFNIDFDMNKREKLIVATGRLVKQKNFNLLINAFAEIASEFQEYILTIYGEGPLREELLTLAKTHDLENRILLPGFVDNIVDRLGKAALFVLSSDYEGMPNALIEAMSLGVPCIATDCDGGGARALINSGENGLLIPKNDVKELVNSMRQVLGSKDVSLSLGENAKKIRDTLGYYTIYERWLTFITDR